MNKSNINSIILVGFRFVPFLGTFAEVAGVWAFAIAEGGWGGLKTDVCGPAYDVESILCKLHTTDSLFFAFDLRARVSKLVPQAKCTSHQEQYASISG